MTDRKIINTKGGAFVEKDVNTNGDFAGRDITHSMSTMISGNSIVALMAIFFIGIIGLAIIVRPDTRTQTPNWATFTERPKLTNTDTVSLAHATNESLSTSPIATVMEQFHGNIVYNGDVRGIDFSPDGLLFATAGGNDHTAVLWDANTGKQVRLLVGNSVVSSVAFSSDGTLFATDSNLFDITTGERINRLSGGYDVAFSPDGRFVATASGYDPFLGTKLFDSYTGKLIRQISDEYAPALAFSHDGKILATATGYLGKGVHLWNPENGELVRTLDGPSGSVAFSHDGKYVATAGGGTVRLFRLETGEHLRDIDGYIVVFSPVGRVLATVGEDRRVRFYDPANGNPIRTLDNVYADQLAFSPDGKRFVALSPDDSIWMVKMPPLAE